MRAWSSAMTMRVLGMEDLFGNRYLERDVSAVPGRGVEAHLPAEDLHAFAHAEEAEAASRLGRPFRALRVEPLAVVLDLDEQPLLVGGDLQEDVLGLRVAGHVEERLLNDAEDRGRDFLGHAALDVLELAPDGDAERLDMARGVPAHGGEEAEVVEDRRAQVEDDAVQVVKGASREALDLLEARARPAFGQLAKRALEPKGQGGDRLARLVVQLARNAHALAFLSAQEALEQLGAPVIAVAQLGVQALKLFPWGVVVRERATHAFAPAFTFRRRMLALTPVFLSLAALFTWGAARSVLQPLFVLTRAAERITGGDLVEPIPPLPDDEVGRLGRSLETMRVRLGASLDEIRSANEQLEARVTARTQELQRLYAELRDRDERRAELLKRFLSAQERERMRIARELHDATCQTIAALSFRLESALGELPEGGTRASLEEVKGLAGRALDDLHRVIFDLRPSILDDLGLLAAVRWYAARHIEPLGIAVRCEFEDVESRVPKDVATAVFRIVQEALLNVARHAKAENVLLQIAADEKRLLIEIEDDGQGFDPKRVELPLETGRGLGLLGMRESVEILGGKMSLDSAPGNGAHITLEIPIPKEVFHA